MSFSDDVESDARMSLNVNEQAGTRKLHREPSGPAQIELSASTTTEGHLLSS